MDKQKRTAILLWGFTILLLAVIALLLWRTGFFQAIASEETLAVYIQAFTPWSHLMYFAVQLFSVIRDDTPFYLNESGQPVIVFEPYEIAPGSEGRQEFVI